MRLSGWFLMGALALGAGCGPGWSRGLAAQDTGGGHTPDTLEEDPCTDKALAERRSCMGNCDVKLNNACSSACNTAYNSAIAVCKGEKVDAAAPQQSFVESPTQKAEREKREADEEAARKAATTVPERQPGGWPLAGY